MFLGPTDAAVFSTPLGAWDGGKPGDIHVEFSICLPIFWKPFIYPIVRKKQKNNILWLRGFLRWFLGKRIHFLLTVIIRNEFGRFGMVCRWISLMGFTHIPSNPASQNNHGWDLGRCWTTDQRFLFFFFCLLLFFLFLLFGVMTFWFVTWDWPRENRQSMKNPGYIVDIMMQIFQSSAFSMLPEIWMIHTFLLCRSHHEICEWAVNPISPCPLAT